MRRLGILWVVVLTIGILVAGLAGVVARHPARARTGAAPDPTVTMTVTPPPVTMMPPTVTVTPSPYWDTIEEVTVTPSPVVVTPSPVVVTPSPIVASQVVVAPPVTVTQSATSTATVTLPVSPPVTVTQNVTPPPKSPSQAAPWWLTALAAIGLLGIAAAGAVVVRRVRRHHADLQRERVRVASHPDAGTVNLDTSEPALAHTVRLEPHADRGTPHLEDEP